jgi:hypothetical protein
VRFLPKIGKEPEREGSYTSMRRRIMATKKSSSSKKSASTKGRGKVKKVMHEYKEGTLKSGGRKKVKNPKQAIAIALSEARQSGAKIPKKGAAKKKSAAKKGGAAKKTSAAKKSGAKKSSASRKRS